MFTKILIHTIVVVFVSACSFSAPASIPTSISTSDVVEFSKLNLENILIQDGDLPAGTSGAQLRSKPPQMFKDVPQAEYTVFQQFERQGEPAGGVAVFVYKSHEVLERGYSEILKGMIEAKSITDFGDKANLAVLSMSVLGVKEYHLEALFSRCQALIHIRMTNNSDRESIIAYAERLDTRIDAIVCRN